MKRMTYLQMRTKKSQIEAKTLFGRNIEEET
jgi:hypothetical protein